jgi:hypothetical protein
VTDRDIVPPSSAAADSQARRLRGHPPKKAPCALDHTGRSSRAGPDRALCIDGEIVDLERHQAGAAQAGIARNEKAGAVAQINRSIADLLDHLLDMDLAQRCCLARSSRFCQSQGAQREPDQPVIGRRLGAAACSAEAAIAAMAERGRAGFVLKFNVLGALRSELSADNKPPTRSTNSTVPIHSAARIEPNAKAHLRSRGRSNRLTLTERAARIRSA